MSGFVVCYPPSPLYLRGDVISLFKARIVSTGSMVGVLDALRGNLRQQLEASRDAVGCNIAGLRMLGRVVEQDRTAYMMESEEDRLVKKMRESRSK